MEAPAECYHAATSWETQQQMADKDKNIKRCDVGYPICQLTGLQRPSDTAWYMAGEHLYCPS